MRVQRTQTLPAFLELAGDFLAAREAEHNLIFGICSTIAADPEAYGIRSPYLAVVTDGDDVVGAAVRTPPFRLVLSEMRRRGAVELIANDLVGEQLPGVQGPASTAADFAREWSMRTGRQGRRARRLRAFRLTRVTPPSPSPGHPIDAAFEHQALVAEWIGAFHAESLPEDPPRDFVDQAARWIRGEGRRVMLWINGGRPVSLTGIGGPTPNGIRIGPVYTPPELRGRGYASNLVAAASQRELDAGRRFVFLFTDLANPTANKIYQAIGYEPVADYAEYRFSGLV
jgi:GNAT superfamily N-acetyltransferase